MSEECPYILLIDDDDDDIEMLSTSLEALGLKTRFYNSADKALNFLELVDDPTNLPILIILDSNMPGINGKETLALIKSNNKTKRIPVIIYSTSMPLQFQDTLLQLGAYRCFGKAYSYLDFTAQVGVFKDLANSLSAIPSPSLS